jgi:exonuclease III
MRNMFIKERLEKAATPWQPSITMADVYKIATLSVNCISLGMGMRMLEEFLHKQEVDIILLQEVTHTESDMIWGYKAHTNIGINNRGTAMLTRELITLTNITRLPTGRSMAAS